MAVNVKMEIGNDYLFARLHGIWGRSLHDNVLNSIIHGKRRDDLARILQSRGVNDHDRGWVQKQLNACFIELLDKVASVADARLSDFFLAYIDLYFYENIKTIIQFFYHSDTSTDLDYLLTDSSIIPKINYDTFINSGDIGRLLTALPYHHAGKRIFELIMKVDKDRDFFSFECAIDQLFYEILLDKVKKLKGKTRKAANQLVRMEIDILNLVMILRNSSIYRFEDEELTRYFLKGGLLIDEKVLAAILSAETPRDATRQLPFLYRNILLALPDNCHLSVTVHELWQLHYKTARKLFYDYDNQDYTPPAFLYLKKYEILNINRIFEGFNFDMDSRIINKMILNGGENV